MKKIWIVLFFFVLTACGVTYKAVQVIPDNGKCPEGMYTGYTIAKTGETVVAEPDRVISNQKIATACFHDVDDGAAYGYRNVTGYTPDEWQKKWVGRPPLKNEP